VFRAYESGRDRLVAVKVFRLDLTPEQSAALLDQFQALIAKRIDHPSIASPIAAGLESGAAYLVQEYAVGDSLDVVLRERGPLSLQEVVPLIESLAAAVDHAAARGVHHGSLHLRDIIVVSDSVRMTGFGIGAALSHVSAKLPSRRQYSSPDGPSDLYSLGAIAFEAVTGKRVSAESLNDFEVEYGAACRRAFDMVLAANPAGRRERAGDFASALRAAAGGTPVAPLAPLAPVAPVAPVAPMDDLDLRIEPHPSALLETRADDEGQTRRWPIVAAFVGFAVLALLAVNLFLKSPTPGAIRDRSGVEETTVDLPAKAPPVSPAPLRDVAPALPAPTPSRPASGAVGRGQQPGSLLIRSTPADADVMVNGRARGKTPVALRDLALGSYTILVAREGYASEERKLHLTTRRTAASTQFNLRPASAPQTGKPGGLNVQSRPAGARVFVNDRLVGTTPLAVPDLPAGPATVRIEMDGYTTWSTTVRVGGGEQTRVAASLERQ